MSQKNSKKMIVEIFKHILKGDFGVIYIAEKLYFTTSKASVNAALFRNLYITRYRNSVTERSWQWGVYDIYTSPIAS